MYQEIIVENTREELIQFPDKQWKHIILHTYLNRTIFGYILYIGITHCNSCM